MTSIDELAMRSALADLVDNQPDAPVDRFDGVRRRHARRRRMQAATAAACAALAVAGVGIGVGLRPGHTSVTPAHRDVPSWALPWPEHRSASVPQPVLDGAVRAWRDRMYGEGAPSMYSPRKVIWYVAEPGVQKTQIAVVFEVERDDGDHRLVAGWLNDPANPQSSDNWSLYDVGAPDPHDRNLVISFYLEGADLQEPDNAFLVLTDPSHRTVVPSVPGQVPPVAQLDNGFAILPYGPLRHQLHLALSSGRGPDVPVGVVGLADAPDSQVPALEPPAELVGVPQSRMLSEASGAGDEVGFNESPPAERGRTVIYARCYGGPSLDVTVDSQTSAAVTIPCDDQQHVVDGPALLPGGDKSYEAHSGGPGHSTEITAGTLVAWRVAVVTR